MKTYFYIITLVIEKLQELPTYLTVHDKINLPKEKTNLDLYEEILHSALRKNDLLKKKHWVSVVFYKAELSSYI